MRNSHHVNTCVTVLRPFDDLITVCQSMRWSGSQGQLFIQEFSALILWLLWTLSHKTALDLVEISQFRCWVLIQVSPASVPRCRSINTTVNLPSMCSHSLRT